VPAWLEENLPDIPQVDVASTALAAQMAAEDGERGCHRQREIAASLYGLKTVKKKIEDNPNNFTRFLVIGRNVPEPSGRTTRPRSCSASRIEPGILYHMLAPFSCRKVNLCKIESRPMKLKAWEYVSFPRYRRAHASMRTSQAAVEESARLLSVPEGARVLSRAK
jgi:chorismate mutase / prephenate dehydratase